MNENLALLMYHCLSNNLEMKCRPFKLVAMYKTCPPLSRLDLSSQSELTWTLTMTFRKLRSRFDASSLNNLDYAIQKTIHALIKCAFRNPNCWIQKSVFTLHEATNVIKVLLFK